ncbi:group II truncated hemoglobin [Sphingobium bisphenolivorans]|uniref:group II truncated hemoglobin n=1 Tax=Sphingobium bisphenolivorans TaxID=1335760 RepID=UPI00039C9E08|nr:group II truncated hemoglobin [Sphingobium bisphenolivorans]
MTATVEVQTPFETIGGGEAVRRIVDRFYDLMDSVPAYRDLRALHADDLGPMRHSLTGFLSAWLGGPRDWFDSNPGKCMMSLHAAVPIPNIVADQWVDAMRAAMRDTSVDNALADQIAVAFQRIGSGMINR